MVEINNLTNTRISLKKIKNFIQKVHKALKIKKTISLAFVRSAEIKRLNKIYLRRNRTTDVLSFPNFIQEPKGRLTIKLRTRLAKRGEVRPFGATRRTPPQRGKAGSYNKISEWHSSSTNNFLGEIIISPSQAKKQAKREKHSLEKEIKILILHGLLHLKGFDHKKKKDRIKMEKLEKKLLKSS